MLLQLQLGIDRADACNENEQQDRAEDRNTYCDCIDHLCCFPYFAAFLRKGVLRAG